MEHFLLYSIVSTVFTIFSLTTLEVTNEINNIEESESLPPPNQTIQSDPQAQRAPNLSDDDINPESVMRDPSRTNNEGGTTSTTNFEKSYEFMRAVATS